MAKKNAKSKSSAAAAGALAQLPAVTFLASPAELGIAVRAAREARGLTQDDVADAAKVSRKFVIDVENGKDSAQIGKALTVAMCVGLAGVLVPVEAMKK
jgi:HTH-type transcriptional regulator/antitoxin HipB